MGIKKKTEFSEKLIQEALYGNFLSAKKYQMFNMFVYGWESDYLAITKSGYAYECEIKISRADFFNDIKKRNKHLVLEGKEESAKPNYFYYAVPKDMVSIDEVPDYAGLIYIINRFNISVVKNAKKLTDNKQDINKLNLVDKFYYRMWDREWQLEHTNVTELEHKITALEKDIAWYDNELSLLNSQIEELKNNYGRS